LQEQKRQATREKLSRGEERRLRALAAAEEHLFQMAEAGAKWAVQELLDREKGKAAVKPVEREDTEIHLVHRFPREPFFCPHCRKEIKGDVGGREGTVSPGNGDGISGAGGGGDAVRPEVPDPGSDGGGAGEAASGGRI
jgi:hypothetical protein